MRDRSIFFIVWCCFLLLAFGSSLDRASFVSVGPGGTSNLDVIQKNTNMRHLIASFVLTLLLVILTADQDRRTFTVGNATAARGQKVTGTIEVPPGGDVGQ
jgi:hypothetical protein